MGLVDMLGLNLTSEEVEEKRAQKKAEKAQKNEERSLRAIEKAGTKAGKGRGRGVDNSDVDDLLTRLENDDDYYGGKEKAARAGATTPVKAEGGIKHPLSAEGAPLPIGGIEVLYRLKDEENFHPLYDILATLENPEIFLEIIEERMAVPFAIDDKGNHIYLEEYPRYLVPKNIVKIWQQSVDTAFAAVYKRYLKLVSNTSRKIKTTKDLSTEEKRILMEETELTLPELNSLGKKKLQKLCYEILGIGVQKKQETPTKKKAKKKAENTETTETASAPAEEQSGTEAADGDDTLPIVLGFSNNACITASLDKIGLPAEVILKALEKEVARRAILYYSILQYCELAGIDSLEPEETEALIVETKSLPQEKVDESLPAIMEIIRQNQAACEAAYGVPEDTADADNAESAGA